MRVPWTTWRSNQSILKETSPGCSLEGLMLKLKLQYFGHLMGRTNSFEKTLMLGKIEGGRRGQQRLDGITESMDISLSKLWVYLSFSPLPFTSLLFSALCKASSGNHFAFLYFFFLGMVLITTSCTMSQTSVHSSSGTLSDLIP